MKKVLTDRGLLKKALQAYWEGIFSDSKFYRKNKGGVWYKVVDKSSEGGMLSAHIFWTRETPIDNFRHEVLKKEVYP